MRFLAFLLLILCILPNTEAQKIRQKKLNKDFYKYPRFYVPDFQKLELKVYYPNETFTMDSLRRYAGNNKLLGAGNEPTLASLYPLSLVDNNGDITVEVFLGEMEVKKIEPAEYQDDVAVRGKVTIYIINVEIDMPVYVRVTDRDGNILKEESLERKQVLRYDRRYENVYTDTEDGTSVSLSENNFFTAEARMASFRSIGKAKLTRMAILKRVGETLAYLHPEIYFKRFGDDFELSSGKGKNFNYDELDEAMKSAVKKLNADNEKAIAPEMKVWEKYIAQYDNNTSNGMISKAIWEGLHNNLALAYMYQRDFEKAKYHADLGKTSGVNLNGTIRSRKAMLEAQPDIQLPEKMQKFVDFRKAFANRTQNEGRKYVITADRIGEFIAPDPEPVVEEEVILTGFEKYQARVFMPGTPSATLSLSILSDQDIAKGPFPTYLTRIEGLTTFDAAGMGFTELPDSIGVMTTVDDLDLGGNLFTELPESLGNLTELIVLRLAKNQLRSVPESLGNLSKLKSLNISNNELPNVPASLGNLANLRKLKLSNNRLTEIPETFGNLGELEELNLSNNELTTLPESLKNCKRLKKLILKGNSMSKAEVAKYKTWFPNAKVK